MLSKTSNLTCDYHDDNARLLRDYIHTLTAELDEFGVPQRHKNKREEQSMELQTILALPECKVLVKGNPRTEPFQSILLRPPQHRYE